ncbi:MAG: quinohemoprotein ethanol dehydrogenase [Planctomycetaceae bacterium]|nr:MAG: quinohemoprotein ethanol dehydrogenase [Planctomycetaceae bacterium]
MQRWVWLLCGMMGIHGFAADEPAAWPEKDGPFRNGHAHPHHAQRLPTHWDAETGHHIAWKLPLEGEGHSTPVIAGHSLWFTSATADGHQQFVERVDLVTGRRLQRKLLFENPDPEPLGNAVNTYASPTCVYEPGALYVHFGSYGTACLHPDTLEVVWQRRDLPCRHFRGPGSSPLVEDDLLILTFDGIDQQYLVALNKRTGHTVWRTDRSTDFKDLDPTGKPRGDGDFRKAYSTPLVVRVDGRKQLISVGSRAGFGYDLRTGQELWTFTHPDFNSASRPQRFENLVIVTTGSKAEVYAIRVDASTQGNIDETHVCWKRTRGGPKLPWPIIVGDRLFLLSDNGVLYCLDVRTGEELQARRLGGFYVASPVYANGVLYLCDEAGLCRVVRADDTLEVVATNRLTEGMRASPAIASGALFLRTFSHLYKIAAQTEAPGN